VTGSLAGDGDADRQVRVHPPPIRRPRGPGARRHRPLTHHARPPRPHQALHLQARERQRRRRRRPRLHLLAQHFRRRHRRRQLSRLRRLFAARQPRRPLWPVRAGRGDIQFGGVAAQAVHFVRVHDLDYGGASRQQGAARDGKSWFNQSFCNRLIILSLIIKYFYF